MGFQRCLHLPGGLHNLDCSVAGDVEAMMQAVVCFGILQSGRLVRDKGCGRL